MKSVPWTSGMFMKDRWFVGVRLFGRKIRLGMCLDVLNRVNITKWEVRSLRHSLVSYMKQWIKLNV